MHIFHLNYFFFSQENVIRSNTMNLKFTIIIIPRRNWGCQKLQEDNQANLSLTGNSKFCNFRYFRNCHAFIQMFKSVLENLINCSNQLKKTLFDVAWRSASCIQTVMVRNITIYVPTSLHQRSLLKILDQRSLKMPLRIQIPRDFIDVLIIFSRNVKINYFTQLETKLPVAAIS